MSEIIDGTYLAFADAEDVTSRFVLKPGFVAKKKMGSDAVILHELCKQFVLQVDESDPDFLQKIKVVLESHQCKR